MKLKVLLVTLLTISIFHANSVFGALREYDLTLEQQQISIRDKTAMGMTINGSIPGPTLRFSVGDMARIKVKNEMDVSSSIHWHGLLIPPSMDGVPYVTQVPIEPGASFIYEFPLRQTGTYWYHSHSELQEQSGLYGSIVIDDETHKTDRDHVVLLSDWTTDSPKKVLRTLKRGSEWYALEKGSAQSIVGAARVGKLGAYFMRELQRMPPMDIADVAYDFFLSNGEPETALRAEHGDTVRLRIINGSATTYFHLNFSGGPMTIISADGQLVQPVEKDLFLIGVAETYDVIVSLPGSGSYELRATAHDGSGFTSAWLGTGPRHPARQIPKPNLYEPMGHGDMGSVFALTPAGSMGMPDSAVEAGMFDQPGMSHQMHDALHDSNMNKSGHGASHNQEQNKGPTEMVSGHMAMAKPQAAKQPAMPEGMKQDSSHMPMEQTQLEEASPMQHQMQHDAGAGATDKMSPHSPAMPGMQEDAAAGNHEPGLASLDDAQHDEGLTSARAFGSRFGLLEPDISSRSPLAKDGGPERPPAPYTLLKSATATTLPSDAPIREVRLTLDGDMERYTWFINNKPISETDSIRIRKGEIVRFIMINRTMMHHPMHLHGHFFRVLNGNGDYAPLKHTVDVGPMSTTVIEFYSDEVGDWLFHCHLLYHMKSGMSRLVHYEDFEPDPDVKDVRGLLYRDPYYFFGNADLSSNMTEGTLTLANSRYSFDARWEAGWQQVEETDWEGLFTADYYFNRFTSIFAGIDLLGEGSSSDDTRGVAGLRYLLPLNFKSAFWLDSDGGGRFLLEKGLHLTPRFGVDFEVEYDTHTQWEGKIEMSYLVSRNVSLIANWHSEYAIGAGIRILF
jgi:hypothetical protein